MREPVYKCPVCNKRLTDCSTRNEKGKITHLLYKCDYCDTRIESFSDDRVDPVVCKNSSGEYIDMNTGSIYLLDTESEEYPTDYNQYT